MLKLTFLGTSAGVPTKNRNVTSLAIQLQHVQAKHPKTWIMIDCGEGTQHQLLKTPLSLLDLQLICITHVHGDHCYGLPGILASMAMLGRTQKLTIIAPKAIAKLLDTLTITTELYFPYVIDFIDIESMLQSANPKFQLNIHEQHQLMICPILLSHRTPSYAFKISQNIQYACLNTEKLQQLQIPPSNLWGQLKQGKDVCLDNGQILLANEFVTQKHQTTHIIVGGDNDDVDLLTDDMDDVTLLVHEATYTQATADKILQRQDGFNPRHSSAKQVACFAQKMALPYLILTHFSSRFQMFDDVNDKTPNMGHIRAEVAAHYQGQFWLAEDFQQYQVVENTVMPE